MKKRFALLFGIVVLALFLTACSSEPRIKSSSVTEEVPGRYRLFQTTSSDEYLNFLENFDEATYDIVDITVGHDSYSYRYSITYRDKIETE